MKSNRTVAIVCDWLVGVGGAEKVLKAIHDIYPDAPIYTSQYRPKQAIWFRDAKVKTGWMNILPVSMKRLVPFLRQYYFSHLDLSAYDLVISVTGAEAKGVKTGDATLHVSYMHAPTQYYWTLYDQYIKDPGFGPFNVIVRQALKLLVKPLRRADYKAAQRPDVIISNSSYIQSEIKKYYKRDSTVVWPNVDIEGIARLAKKQPAAKREGYIIYGRQVSWKRMDIAVRAALENGMKLTVIGDGPEHDRLVAMAENAPNITFLPKYDGIQEIITHIKRARAFIFPSLEPFGIAPVESLAAGTPVIGLRAGGALDIIEEGCNGIFFEKQTVESLLEAIVAFESLEFSERQVIRSADKFSEQAFTANFKRCIQDAFNKHE